MFSINESVTPYIDELLGREEELAVRSYYLENQSTVIDCGVEAPGSIGAGMLATAIALGGLGKVSLVPGIIDGFYLQFAQVWVDNPAIACLCSQMPAWKIKNEDFNAVSDGQSVHAGLQASPTIVGDESDLDNERRQIQPLHLDPRRGRQPGFIERLACATCPDESLEIRRVNRFLHDVGKREAVRFQNATELLVDSGNSGLHGSSARDSRDVEHVTHTNCLAKTDRLCSP
jgi:hypothetical protein